MSRHSIYILFSFVLSNLWAQEDQISLFTFLKEQKVDQLVISTDLQSLLKRKDVYQVAWITAISGLDTVLQYMGEIRSRGNVRKDICYIPPTKIRFDKTFLRSMNLQDYPTLKIVNQCTLSDRDQQYLTNEYLIYQLYQLLTSNTLRSHRISIIYQDDSSKRKPKVVDAFLLEHVDELADRLGGEVYEAPFFNEKMLHKKSYVLFGLFQYMIGNTDWNIANLHNVEIVTIPQQQLAIPVAYDFDYAGLVHAHYAVPHKRLDMRDVIERRYLGPCLSDHDIDLARELFLSKEQETYEILESFPLSKSERRFCLDYLETFFDTLRDPKIAKRTFGDCPRD